MPGGNFRDSLLQVTASPETSASDAVYIMYEKPYKHFDRMMAEMEKQGLISKEDRDLYKIVKSPFEIAADLRARREAGLLRLGTNKPMIGQSIGS
jgi:hypothetical protein